VVIFGLGKPLGAKCPSLILLIATCIMSLRYFSHFKLLYYIVVENTR